MRNPTIPQHRCPYYTPPTLFFFLSLSLSLLSCCGTARKCYGQLWLPHPKFQLTKVCDSKNFLKLSEPRDTLDFFYLILPAFFNFFISSYQPFYFLSYSLLFFCSYFYFFNLTSLFIFYLSYCIFYLASLFIFLLKLFFYIILPAFLFLLKLF